MGLGGHVVGISGSIEDDEPHLRWARRRENT